MTTYDTQQADRTIEEAHKLYEVAISSIEFGKGMENGGHLHGLGLDATFTTRELLVGPAVAFAASTMGQRGVELAFYRGGIYTGRFWAEDTVAAGLADWDESLVDYYCLSCTAFGWGIVTRDSVSFDGSDPRVCLHLKNTPTSTTSLKILKAMQKDDPKLTIDTNRPFCLFFAGFIEGYTKLILTHQGLPEAVIKEVRGRETLCQAGGADHCVIEVARMK
jgi:hypothetical protein